MSIRSGLNDSGRDVRQNLFAYILIAPTTLLILAVVVYPIAYAIEFSLHRTMAFSLGRFIGLANYRNLATPTVLNDVMTSLIFIGGSIVLAVGGGLLLALALNQRIALRTTARMIIFIPWVTSQLAAALVWRWLFNSDYGPIVYSLHAMGFHHIDFLGDPTLAMALLICTNAWHSVAFSMIVLLAAIQTIPESTIRAAAVDGAHAWLSFRAVTLPQLWPSIMVCIVMSSFSYFNIITIPLVLTGGGPGSATELLTLRMYQEAFSYFHLGFASTLTILILALNVGLTLIYLRIPGAKGLMA